MTAAVLAQGPAPRRLRPGLRRALMAGASVLLHVAVLGPMILLAASEEHPLPEPPPPPIIQLQIEPRPTPPQPRFRPVPPITIPTPQPLPDPLTEPPPAPQPAPQPASMPSVQAAPLAPPLPAPPRPAPQPQPQAVAKPTPKSAPAPAPVPTPSPLPVPAPVPAPPAAAERATTAPAPVTAIRPRKKDEDEARDGPPSAPAPRVAAPAPGAPSAAAAGAPGVSDAWRFAPGSQAERNARALRTSPAGCRSTAVLTQGEQAICDERFNARAAEGASRGAISGTGNAARDARFAREGAREMQRYEAQRRPLSGGVGVMPPQECPGSNFGVGCAGAHLDPSMRQGATTNVRQDSNRVDGPHRIRGLTPPPNR